jgi:hypothetical protein
LRLAQILRRQVQDQRHHLLAQIGFEAARAAAKADETTACNLYSITTNQAAIIALFRVVNRYVGNLAPMPGVFPDYKAPIVRNGHGGTRHGAVGYAIVIKGVDGRHQKTSRKATSQGQAGRLQ